MNFAGCLPAFISVWLKPARDPLNLSSIQVYSWKCPSPATSFCKSKSVMATIRCGPSVLMPGHVIPPALEIHFGNPHAIFHEHNVSRAAIENLQASFFVPTRRRRLARLFVPQELDRHIAEGRCLRDRALRAPYRLARRMPDRPAICRSPAACLPPDWKFAPHPY